MIIAMTLFLLGIVIMLAGFLESEGGAIFLGILMIIAGSFVMQARVDNEKKDARVIQRNDYNIDITNDTILLYSDDTLVGKVITKWNSPLDSLIMKDNQ